MVTGCPLLRQVHPSFDGPKEGLIDDDAMLMLDKLCPMLEFVGDYSKSEIRALKKKKAQGCK